MSTAPKPVTILRDADGQAVGVMVETLDERFVLELHHIDGGKEYPHDKAMERLKELGKEGLNIKQGNIVAAYHEEIDAALEEAGGDKLGWEWISDSGNNGHCAWWYCPALGALGYNLKYTSYPVRALIVSEQIERKQGGGRMNTELKQYSKELYDIMEVFERTILVYAYVPSKFDKAEKKLWTKGYYYNNGKVNELFRVFLGGYAYGKAEGGAE